MACSNFLALHVYVYSKCKYLLILAKTNKLKLTENIGTCAVEYRLDLSTEKTLLTETHLKN